MTNSLRKGIVLWELREQKCQQHVCPHLDAVHPGQAGWMVLILQWKMVMSPGRSAEWITFSQKTNCVCTCRYYSEKKTTNIAENLKSNAQRFESHWEFFLCIFIQFK